MGQDDGGTTQHFRLAFFRRAKPNKRALFLCASLAVVGAGASPLFLSKQQPTSHMSLNSSQSPTHPALQPQQANDQAQPKAPPVPSPTVANSSSSSTKLTVNGRNIPLDASGGSYHSSTSTPSGQSSVDISVTHNGSASNTSIDLHSSSQSSTSSTTTIEGSQ